MQALFLSASSRRALPHFAFAPSRSEAKGVWSRKKKIKLRHLRSLSSDRHVHTLEVTCEPNEFLTADTFSTVKPGGLRHLAFVSLSTPLRSEVFTRFSRLTKLELGNEFNHPLGESLRGLRSLTSLTFGHYFNHPFGESLLGLSSLTSLTFGNIFNHPLEDSLRGLRSLTSLRLGS